MSISPMTEVMCKYAKFYLRGYPEPDGEYCAEGRVVA